MAGAGPLRQNAPSIPRARPSFKPTVDSKDTVDKKRAPGFPRRPSACIPFHCRPSARTAIGAFAGRSSVRFHSVSSPVHT